jgi:hypothetical protein
MNPSGTEQNASRQLFLKGLVFLLVAATLVLSFVEFILVFNRLMVLFIAQYGDDAEAIFKARYTIDAFRIFSFIILAFGWLLFFLITTNYHFKYATKPRSWKLLAWTTGVELVILLLVLLI